VSTTHVALLRGVNVGGKNKLPMKELAAMFTEEGCDYAQTYIQSGNVIFRAAPRTVSRLPGAIASRIAARYGYRTPVVLRTTEQIRAIVANNPFLSAGVAEDLLHVLFLAKEPDGIRIEALDPQRSAPDAFAIYGADIYLKLPTGAGRTKLTNAYFDNKLDTISTGRNWRTVIKLLELMRCVI
jgi:uncharacterized protein (DUF1697 family)